MRERASGGRAAIFHRGQSPRGIREWRSREWNSTRLFTNPLTASPLPFTASQPKQMYSRATWSRQLRRLVVDIYRAARLCLGATFKYYKLGKFACQKMPIVFVKRKTSILFRVNRERINLFSVKRDLDPPLPIYSAVGKRLRESQKLNQPSMHKQFNIVKKCGGKLDACPADLRKRWTQTDCLIKSVWLAGNLLDIFLVIFKYTFQNGDKKTLKCHAMAFIFLLKQVLGVVC